MSSIATAEYMVSLLSTKRIGDLHPNHVIRNTNLRCDAKLRKLGHGSYSTVYETGYNDGFVIKITNMHLEDGYVDYALWCMKMQRERKAHPVIRYLPRIYRVWVVNKTAVIVQEKLEKLPESIMEMDTQNDNLIGARHDFCGCYEMIDALGYPDDMHTGNIMQRGEQLVFTDPYAGKNKDYIRYVRRDPSYVVTQFGGVCSYRHVNEIPMPDVPREDDKKCSSFEDQRRYKDMVLQRYRARLLGKDSRIAARAADLLTRRREVQKCLADFNSGGLPTSWRGGHQRASSLEFRDRAELAE